MSKKSIFDDIAAIFKIARPAIEQGISSMQPPTRQRVERIWEELVTMIETKDDDIEKFSDKLREFNRYVYQYRLHSRILNSDISIKTI